MINKMIITEQPLIFSLENILSAEYCQELIDLSENQYEYTQAQITIGDNLYRTDTDIRNNDRVIFDDQNLANTLFDIVKPCLPECYHDLWLLKGLNERFRFYRYQQGQTFKPHFDGAFKRSRYEKSFLTLIFYLNDDFTGGETTFFRYQGKNNDIVPHYQYKPQNGNALIFDHQQLHEGSEVTSGVKYVLRTDVMYAVL